MPASLTDHAFLEFGILFLAGLLAGEAARLVRVPDVALFLLAGVALGPSGLGAVDLSDSKGTAALILTFGAAFMLYEGGREVDLAVFAGVWRTVALLATLGVVVTAAVVGVAAHALLGLAWLPAFLLASVLAPTDPATIIPVLRQIRVRPRLAEAARAESAFNDATGAVLVLALVAVLSSGGLGAGELALRFVWLLAGGLLIGLLAGYLAAASVAHGSPFPRIFERSESGPIVSLVAVIAAYTAAELAGASGFMAVFAAGVVVGNKDRFGMRAAPGHEEVHGTVLGVAALALRMLIFEILGASLDLPLLLARFLPFLGLAACLVFVARPLTVLASAWPDRAARWQGRELAFLMWVRETGVIPAALAGILVAEGVPGAHLVQGSVFMAVAATVLGQASTTPWLARRLGVLADEGAERPGGGSARARGASAGEGGRL
ncbi:MAG: cation:proton antiporter [Clostridia bacterium]|nr:cation:proton antiporter [Clostridia bacterium]